MLQNFLGRQKYNKVYKVRRVIKRVATKPFFQVLCKRNMDDFFKIVRWKFVFGEKKRKRNILLSRFALNISCQLLLALNAGFHAIDLGHGVVVRATHVVTRIEVMGGGDTTHPLFAVAFFPTGSKGADKGDTSDDYQYFFHCFLILRLEIIVKARQKYNHFEFIYSLTPEM